MRSQMSAAISDGINMQALSILNIRSNAEFSKKAGNLFELEFDCVETNQHMRIENSFTTYNRL